MNVRDLKKWLAELPPEFDEAPVESIVHSIPTAAKRVVAYTYKDGSGRGVFVNSMGTHYSDDFAAGVTFHSVLHN